MLVLSRRPDEKIPPTVPVLIKVLSTHSGLVRLGIEAPASVPVLREELTRSDRPRPATPRPAPEVAPPHVSLGNLLLGLTLLRVQLTHCNPAVRQTLDGIEQELETLRASIEAHPHPVVAG